MIKQILHLSKINQKLSKNGTRIEDVNRKRIEDNQFKFNYVDNYIK